MDFKGFRNVMMSLHLLSPLLPIYRAVICFINVKEGNEIIWRCKVRTRHEEFLTDSLIRLLLTDAWMLWVVTKAH